MSVSKENLHIKSGAYSDLDFSITFGVVELTVCHRKSDMGFYLLLALFPKPGNFGMLNSLEKTGICFKCWRFS